MSIFSKIKHWRYEIIALIFTIWGFYYRFTNLAGRTTFSEDERNQIRHTVGPFRSLLDRSGNGELTAFPGDYMLKWPFVQWFGPDNRWLLHIPHYIINALGFFLMYKICKRYIKSPIAFVIPFMFMAFNRNLVFHSFEFRPYAVLPTMALAIFYFSDLVINNHQTLSRLQKILIGILFFYFTIYHAYGLMIILACSGFFMIKKCAQQSLWITIKETAHFYIPFLIFAIPTFIFYATGVTWFTKEHTASRNIKTFAYIPNPMEQPNTFFRTMLGNLLGFKKFKLKHLVWGITISALIPNKQKPFQLLFLVTLIIAPIGAILFSDIQKGYWFIQRQFVWAMPLFAFLVGWCWDSIIDCIKTKPWKSLTSR